MSAKRNRLEQIAALLLCKQAELALRMSPTFASRISCAA